MTDIVERLRNVDVINYVDIVQEYALEAADEIERLREHLTASEARFEDIWNRSLKLERALQKDDAEIERLQERVKQLMGPAERYWEERWRDADAEIERLRDQVAARNDIINGWPRQDAEIERLQRLTKDLGFCNEEWLKDIERMRVKLLDNVIELNRANAEIKRLRTALEEKSK